MRGQLFPDLIECAFLKSYRCEGCGRSAETLLVSFPSLVWRRDDETILVSYPVRCSCGLTGLATTRLPFLLFCFICGWLEYQSTAQCSPRKSPQPVQPNDSPFLSNIFCDFQQVMASSGVEAVIEFIVEPGKSDAQGHAVGEWTNQPTAADRALFGVSPEAWCRLLRRMGFSENEEGQA